MDTIRQPAYMIADDYMFLKYSLIVSGIYALELGFSKLKDVCSVLGRISYLLPSNDASIVEGTVTVHLPSVGYTKQTLIAAEGLFHVRLETPGVYIFLFEVCEKKFSVSVDLEGFGPPKNLLAH